jgi:nitrogen fixation protein NifZ
MNLRDLQPGDMVYAAATITNDGSMPDLPDETVLAEKGTRGVLINAGHLEEDPSQELFLVRFETGPGELGPPTGCWPEELAMEAPTELT